MVRGFGSSTTARTPAFAPPAHSQRDARCFVERDPPPINAGGPSLSPSARWNAASFGRAGHVAADSLRPSVDRRPEAQPASSAVRVETRHGFSGFVLPPPPRSGRRAQRQCGGQSIDPRKKTQVAKRFSRTSRAVARRAITVSMPLFRLFSTLIKDRRDFPSESLSRWPLPSWSPRFGPFSWAAKPSIAGAVAPTDNTADTFAPETSHFPANLHANSSSESNYCSSLSDSRLLHGGGRTLHVSGPPSILKGVRTRRHNRRL